MSLCGWKRGRLCGGNRCWRDGFCLLPLGTTGGTRGHRGVRKSHVWRTRNESAEEHRDRAQVRGSSNITAATLAKDIRLEWRSKDAINAMLFFSLLVVVIFSFSFDPTAEESREIAGVLVWVAFLF